MTANERNTNRSPAGRRTGHLVRYLLLAAILLSVVAGAMLVARALAPREAASPGAATELLSASALEETYGVRIYLIGVTAGGGLVDFRLKILDAEKARQLLKDATSMPVLVADESGTTLRASDGEIDVQNLDSAGVIFVLYPNTRGAVQPGDPVTVVFGDVRVGPITAQ